MKTNYAEICSVGKLQAEFQQVPLVVVFFSEISQYGCKTAIIQMQQRKLKNVFLA